MAVIKTEQFDTRSARRSNKLPVTQPVPDSGQVQNSDGGYVWELNDWDRLIRFLILGAEGGTYYIGERDLLGESHDVVLRCIQNDGARAIKEIVDVSVKGRAYKNDPAIFALALATSKGDDATRRAAYLALPQVCRIGTHLYHFTRYCAAMKGTGFGYRRALSRWFTEMPVEKLAMQVIKYQQRDGWSARDVLRVAHPSTSDKARQAVFRWVVGGSEALGARTVVRRIKGNEVERKYPSVRSKLPKLIEAFEKAKTADTKTLINLINDHDLPREAIPTDKLNQIEVWEALLQKMPMAALIRNLGKMSSIGLLKPMSTASRLVCDRLGNREYLRRARVHPLGVLIAAKTYEAGHGLKGSLSWTPVPAILTALDTAFYATFENVVPCGKPLLIALDVSGSMSMSISGTPISSCEAVAALSLVHLNVEPECHVFGFADSFRDLGIRKGMTLQEACRRAQKNNFGSTDISLAVRYATSCKLKVGGFIVMTDNEVNCGPHPALVLREYRKRFVPDARSVFVATAANGFTVNDPNDKFGLDVAGFDASVPPVIADFIRGGQTGDSSVVSE